MPCTELAGFLLFPPCRSLRVHIQHVEKAGNINVVNSYILTDSDAESEFSKWLEKEGASGPKCTTYVRNATHGVNNLQEHLVKDKPIYIEVFFKH